jgi:hypothetical protein
MASKCKPKAPTVEHNPNNLVVERKKEQTDAEALAETALRPCVNGAMTIKGCGRQSFGELDLTALIGELSSQAKLARGGNLERVEETLLTQAHTLDALFNTLTRLSLSNTGNLTVMESCMRLGLKAQSQCRTTLEALAEIKNPKSVAFIRQANLAQGPQQVNNGVDSSRAGKNEIEQNKLLEGHSGNGEWLDTGKAGAAAGNDPAVASLEALDRAEIRGRQGEGFEERR